MDTDEAFALFVPFVVKPACDPRQTPRAFGYSWAFGYGCHPRPPVVQPFVAFAPFVVNPRVTRARRF